MTIVDNILVGVLVAILSSIVGAVLVGKGKASKEDLERHTHPESLTPHTVCAIHTTELTLIKAQLNRMDGKLDRLLEK